MKKSLILFPVLAAIAACGNSGEKGPTIARINGETFTEGDLDLRLSSLDDSRREDIMKDPVLRRDEFNNILHARLFSLAGQDSKFSKLPEKKHRFELTDQRVMTQYYFETYLGQNAGYTRKEIEDYYNAHTSSFTGDSGKIVPFYLAAARATDSLIASRANLDSLYKANGQSYKKGSTWSVSLIQTATRKQAEAAVKALKGGMAFGSAAAKFSNHASKAKQGSIGRVQQGTFVYEIGSQAVVDSLFFNPDTRLKAGQYSGILPKDKSFIIVSADSFQAEAVPPLAEIRDPLIRDYVQQYKVALGQGAAERLKKKYGLRLISTVKEPTEKDIQAYYDQNKESYESPETFELYHIEATDEAKLKATLSGIKDLDGFKKAAARLSENPLTRAQDGYVGVVKRDFSLPYGIGVLPSLFPALDDIKASGKVETVVENAANQKWHAFWLVKKGPRQLKPLDRVRTLVKEDLRTNQIANVRPEDSLAVLNTGRVIRESDVLFLKEEIPPAARERYTREILVDYLAIWQTAAYEASALGLDKERRLRAMRMQNEDVFWGNVYQDSVLSRNFEDDPALLEKTFKAHKALFAGASEKDWHPYARDVAAYLLLTPKEFQIEYHTNPDRYSRDTVPLSFDESQAQIFQSLKPLGYARLDDQVTNKLKARYKVTIVDPALQDPSLEPVAETYKKAQDLHYQRQLEPALNLYQKLRDGFPDRAGLQDSISFGMAQIYVEQERFPQALAEYRRVSYLYPNSPNNYKAMFMVGFIYSEHLKNDSAAVRSFQKMLKVYPSSDLSDDADWMIRNIRSGGKLMPALQDDADSTSKDKGAAAPQSKDLKQSKASK